MTQPRRRRRQSTGRWGSFFLFVVMLIDRYLVWVSLGGVAGIWILSDWLGLTIGSGAKEALTMFTGYALLKSKTDRRWRQLEAEREQMSGLVERLEATAPGSPEALEVRRELVELAKQADGGHDDE